MYKTTCAECGTGFTASRSADFCGTLCRQTFNNRRATRGAMLFDLVMASGAAGVQPAHAREFEDRAKAAVVAWREEDRQANRKRATKRVNDIMFDTLRFAVR